MPYVESWLPDQGFTHINSGIKFTKKKHRQLPRNYPQVLGVMVAEVAKSPNIEVVGIILTDQLNYMELISRGQGTPTITSCISPFSEQLSQFPNFTTYIRFHNHPSGNQQFSMIDTDGYEDSFGVHENFIAHQRNKQLFVPNPFYIYDFLLPRGKQLTWRALTIESEI
jgi:hypothetical protein